MRAVISSITDGLRSHPFALALVVINALFVIACVYGFREISESAARRDALLAQLIADDCKAALKGDRQ